MGGKFDRLQRTRLRTLDESRVRRLFDRAMQRVTIKQASGPLAVAGGFEHVAIESENRGGVGA